MYGSSKIDRLVLATGGQEDAGGALRAAVDLASRSGAKLHLAHAWRFDAPYTGYADAGWSGYEHLYERAARRRLEAQIEAIETLGGTVAEAHLLKKHPIDAILDLCDGSGPDLLVMDGRNRERTRRIGGVSESVVHHAWCPVMVLPGGEDAWPPSRVVIGHDGSESAGRAAALAAYLGRLLGAGSVLVRAHQHPPAPVGGWSAEDRSRLDEAARRAAEDLEGSAEALGKAFGAVSERKVVQSDPVLTLLEAAGENGPGALIAVGSRSFFGATSRARLGSVSTGVLGAARGPVLVCPPSARVDCLAGRRDCRVRDYAAPKATRNQAPTT
jgi:nucleotide-binding universal stress UspA family protein